MNRVILAALLFCCVASLPARAEPEPVNGCLMAAANRREVLRAQHYLHPAIPSRLLRLRSADGRIDHAALVYRLPEGWVCYDDTCRDQVLHRLRWPDAHTFPPALTVARAAFPGQPIAEAWWMEPAPSR